MLRGGRVRGVKKEGEEGDRRGKIVVVLRT